MIGAGGGVFRDMNGDPELAKIGDVGGLQLRRIDEFTIHLGYCGKALAVLLERQHGAGRRSHLLEVEDPLRGSVDDGQQTRIMEQHPWHDFLRVGDGAGDSLCDSHINGIGGQLAGDAFQRARLHHHLLQWFVRLDQERRRLVLAAGTHDRHHRLVPAFDRQRFAFENRVVVDGGADDIGPVVGACVGRYEYTGEREQQVSQIEHFRFPRECWHFAGLI